MLLFTFLMLSLSPVQADENIQVEFTVPENIPMFSEAEYKTAKSTDKPYDCATSLGYAKGKMERKGFEMVLAYNPSTFLKDEALAQKETCEDVGGKGKKSRVKLGALLVNKGKTPAYKANSVTGRRAIEIWKHLDKQRIFGAQLTVKVKPARGALFFFDDTSSTILTEVVDKGMDAKDLHDKVVRGYILFKMAIAEQMQKAFTVMQAVPELSGLSLEVNAYYYNKEGVETDEYWTFIMRTDEIAKLVESEFTLGQFLDTIIIKRGTSSEDIAASTVKFPKE